MTRDNYRSLDSARLEHTTNELLKRISDRFPQSGLSKVCAELVEVVGEAGERADSFTQPQLALRVSVIAAISVMAGLFIILPAFVKMPSDDLEITELVGMLEAGTNLLVLVGAGVIFLVTTESRVKRKVALKAMFELRSLAHVVDTHQLTKDPGRLVYKERSSVSPAFDMTLFELSRYLDYCSEMLSIIGKIAALYVQQFDDPVVLNAANEVENLSTGLSRKVWQKLMILYRFRETASQENNGGEKG